MVSPRISVFPALARPTPPANIIGALGAGQQFDINAQALATETAKQEVLKNAIPAILGGAGGGAQAAPGTSVFGTPLPQDAPTGQTGTAQVPSVPSQQSQNALAALAAVDPSTAKTVQGIQTGQIDNLRNLNKDAQERTKTLNDQLGNLATGLSQIPDDARMRQVYASAVDQLAKQGLDTSSLPSADDPDLRTFLQGAGLKAASISEQFGRLPKTPEQESQAIRIAEAGATTVNVGPDGIDYGKPPTDFAWARNPDGSVLLRTDEGSGLLAPVAVPIQGGPAAVEAGKEKEAAANKAKQEALRSDIVVQDIDRILGIVQDSTVPVTGAGSFLSQIRGTPASDVNLLLQSVKAAVSFERLQQMRDASATGGALGQVSNVEIGLLQSALGALDQSLNEDEFVFNLSRVRDVYNQIVHGPTPAVPIEQSGNVPGAEKSFEQRVNEATTVEQLDALEAEFNATQGAP